MLLLRYFNYQDKYIGLFNSLDFSRLKRMRAEVRVHNYASDPTQIPVYLENNQLVG